MKTIMLISDSQFTVTEEVTEFFMVNKRYFTKMKDGLSLMHRVGSIKEFKIMCHHAQVHLELITEVMLILTNISSIELEEGWLTLISPGKPNSRIPLGCIEYFSISYGKRRQKV